MSITIIRAGQAIVNLGGSVSIHEAVDISGAAPSALYRDKLLSVASTGLIAYWPLGESSGSIAHDDSGNGRDGAYSGGTLGQAGIGDGSTAVYFPGSNAYVGIYSAGLAAAFNGAEGTALVWARVASAGVWTGPSVHYILLLDGGSNTAVRFFAAAGSSVLNLLYLASGKFRTVSIPGMSTTDWMSLAITWSQAADEVRVYMNGQQQGSTLTELGVWTGPLRPGKANVGCWDSGKTYVWDGWLAHVALWNQALSAATMATLGVV